MKRISMLVMAAVIIVCSLTGCMGKTKKNKQLTLEKTGFAFDTVISIAITSDKAEELLVNCFAICTRFENTLSRTGSNSRLYEINHRTSNDVVLDLTQEGDCDIKNLYEAGRMYYELSGGKFDITVAPLADLWNFKSENPIVPAAQEIQQALAGVGVLNTTLLSNGEDEKSAILRFADERTQIDFGGLAKGYVADYLRDYLLSQGVKRAKINLGGNVLTIGVKDEDSSWKIGIQKPFGADKELLGYVEATNRSVVSSGIYERYFQTGENLYHHVLDPATGYPADNGLYQVTILSESSLQGDGLSTSCLLLGAAEGMKLLEEIQGVDGIFVLANGEVLTTQNVVLHH